MVSGLPLAARIINSKWLNCVLNLFEDIINLKIKIQGGYYAIDFY